VREDLPDVDNVPSVFNSGDQAVFVARDVENRKALYAIGMWEILAYIDQIRPGGAFGQMVPVKQWR